MIWMCLWQIWLQKMLWLTCRDFQVDFDDSLWETVRYEQILINVWLPCMVRSTIVSDLHLHKMSKFIQNLSSQKFPQQSISYEKPHFMQFSVATRELCTLHCVLFNCNGTKYRGNALIIPAVVCSQQLLRRNKLPTGCYLIACLVFSPHNMNVFVKDVTADNVVTHMQGFSSGILMVLFEKLCEIWTNLD